MVISISIQSKSRFTLYRYRYNQDSATYYMKVVDHLPISEPQFLQDYDKTYTILAPKLLKNLRQPHHRSLQTNSSPPLFMEINIFPLNFFIKEMIIFFSHSIKQEGVFYPIPIYRIA